MRFIPYWIGLVSLVTLGAMALDKHRALRGRWRIPESRLLALALLGGSPGLIAGMLLFRHKVSKTSFRLAAAAIVVVQLGIAGWFVLR
ncbi:MAG: DUF1294 domain-containing protein [Limisphaerales bacterium]